MSSLIQRSMRIAAALLLAFWGFAQSGQIGQAQGGNPAFNVDSWEVRLPEGADQLERGMEFDLIITFTNIGSAGANEVIVAAGDGQFVALGAGPRFGHMGIGAQATATITIAISNTIETGYYNLPVSFTFHNSQFGGPRLTDMQEIGVYVVGLSPFQGQDTGSPRLVIEGAAVNVSADDPSVLLVELTVRNVGNRSATNIVINLGQSEVFSPALGSSSAIGLDDDIDLDQSTTVVVPLTLIQSPSQRVVQDFLLQYNSYSGGNFTDTQSVPLELGSVTAQAPRLLLQTYSASTDAISPGSTFRLTLDLINVGDGPARQVFVRLGSDATSLDPLAPVGTSNVFFQQEIGAGQQQSVSFDLVVDGDAEAGLVPIDVLLEYEDNFGVAQQETIAISLQIVDTAFVSISLFEPLPPIILVGDVFDVPIDITNIGERQINVNTVEVVSDALDIVIDGPSYIGPLDGGTSGSVIASATALESGTVSFEVRVNYLDSFQQPRVLTQTFTLMVEDTEGASFNEESNITIDPETDEATERTGAAAEDDLTLMQRILRGLLGFFGLGGLVS
ncbi:MAG: hypothetical protein GYB68_15720 [Chloroflexi bacterium]|nr:hypothetical protein [Chloroflexota bacterium]